MTDQAVHLGLAGDMSTDSFILALFGFKARRGHPKSIRSDNGSNFIGADRELRTAGEGGGHFFNSSLPRPPASQKFRR